MKKLILTVMALSFSISASANDLDVKDYNYRMTDLADVGISKEKVYEKMNRTMVKPGNSICANRAQVWAFDFKRNYDADAAKIFLFYTDKTGEGISKDWWYHVAPMIGENGKAYVMDAGFPRSITTPLSKEQWLKRFTKTTLCKEIQASEEDLLSRLFKPQQFPETTSYGTYDCYYKIVPAGYWFPSSVAMGLLQRDSEGNSINFSRPEIDRQEVYSACIETATTSLGRILGSGRAKCKKYLSL